MNAYFRSSICTAAVICCLGAPMGAMPAAAFDPSGNEVADAFLSLLETEDGKVESYGSVTESGDTVTITDLQLSHDGGDDSKAKIATAALSSGSILDNGRLKLGGLKLDSLEIVADDGSLSAGSFSATDLVLPTAEEIEKAGENSVIGPSYSTLEVLDVQITDEDSNKIELSRLFTAIDEMDGDLPTASRFAVDGLKVDAENLDDDGKKALADLGYERMNLSVEGDGRWDPEAATAKINNFMLTGEDVGTLSLNLSLGGITRDLVAKLGEVKEPEQAMGLLQGVSVEGISINLDNSSIVERILDMQAKEAGTDRATLVKQLSAGLPFMLSFLQNQAFQDKVASAATTFLNEPKSLKVVAAPSSPVPVAQIMGQAMMAPQALPEILGVDITANGGN